MNRLLGSIVVKSLAPSPLLAWTTQAVQFTATFVVVVLQRSETKNNVYNILWALVFGFATLNILNLGTKHFEPGKNRLSFGELSRNHGRGGGLEDFISWEMLYLFKVLPLQDSISLPVLGCGQSVDFCCMIRVMAKPPQAFEVTCPCCGALLKVDPGTKAVIAHTAAVAPKMFNDIEEAAQAMGKENVTTGVTRFSVSPWKHKRMPPMFSIRNSKRP